jgi:hypothetical protein
VTDARHPQDPDPVRATKASAVLGLGVLAVLTGPLVGGVIPATIALVLARESRRELVAAQGFLLGSSRLHAGVRLAWTGIVLALVALTVAAIIGLLASAGASGRDFAPTVN